MQCEGAKKDLVVELRVPWVKSDFQGDIFL